MANFLRVRKRSPSKDGKWEKVTRIKSWAQLIIVDLDWEMNQPCIFMAVKYRIEWAVPDAYKSQAFLFSLPSPISREMTEIYNYRVEDVGFYFIDNQVDDRVAGHALKLFVDEALKNSSEVRIFRIE